MNELPAPDPPPLILKASGALGLFVHVDDASAGELRGRLTEEKAQFTFNPPEAAHLAQPVKAIFVFGRHHPRVVASLLERCGGEVVIDPDVVITEDLYHPPVRQLLALGQVRHDGRLCYAELGLSRDDVPALIRMATDDQLHEGPQDSPVVWAPVHAWRALGEMRPLEAVAPLVELLHRAEDTWDEWVSGDLPEELAQFGAHALGPLAAYLADTTHGEWARVAAAKALGHLGQTHPELRVECIVRLGTQLDRFADQPDTFNASLLSPLWDLRAVEAMPVIERAFASGRVDESVMGDLEDVEIHFGLKTRREHAPKPNSLTRMGEEFRAHWKAAGLPLPDAGGDFPAPEPDFPWADAGPPAPSVPYIAPPKIGRNEPCPCGSGKKFKKCCGK